MLSSRIANGWIDRSQCFKGMAVVANGMCMCTGTVVVLCNIYIYMVMSDGYAHIGPAVAGVPYGGGATAPL